MSGKLTQWRKIYKNFQQDFYRFANQSTMKALTFISNSEYVPESIIWLIVILIFIGLTIWNVTVTIQNYQRLDTLSKVSSSTRKSIEFPNPSLCFMRNIETPLNAFIQAGELHLPNNSNFFEQLENEVNRLERLSNDLASKCATTKCWTKDYPDYMGQLKSPKPMIELLQSSWLLVRIFNEVEINQDIVGADFQPIANLINQYKHLSELLDKLENFDKLRRLVGSLICYNMGLFTTSGISKFVNQSRTTKYTLRSACSRENVMWLGITPSDSDTDYLCIRIKSKKWLSYTLHERKTTFLHFRLLDHMKFANASYNAVQLSLDSDIYPNMGNPNTLQLKEKYDSLVYIQQLGLYKNYHHTDSNKCSGSTAISKCFGYRSAEHSISHCKCWPTTWENLTRWANETDVKTCSLHNYFHGDSVTECLEDIHKNVDDLEKNQKNCKPPCEYTLFHFETKDIREGLINLEGTTLVELRPKSFVHNEFEEFLAMDLRGFLSALGGSLSLWIGASFIGLLHAFAYIIRKIFQYVKGKIYLKRLRRKTIAIAALQNMRIDTVSSKKSTADNNAKLAELHVLLAQEESKEILKKLLLEVMKDMD